MPALETAEYLHTYIILCTESVDAYCTYYIVAFLRTSLEIYKYGVKYIQCSMHDKERWSPSLILLESLDTLNHTHLTATPSPVFMLPCFFCVLGQSGRGKNGHGRGIRMMSELLQTGNEVGEHAHELGIVCLKQLPEESGGWGVEQWKEDTYA